MASKKKLLTSAIALGTAAALTLGGTFAWQSISQTAQDEASDVVNPGGRLHNDQHWVSALENDNNIYVENFTTVKDGQAMGTPIYARVRVEEYMEIVVNKGKSSQRVFNIAGKKLDKTTGEALEDQNVYSQQGEYDYEYVIHDFANEENNPTSDWWTWKTGKTLQDNGDREDGAENPWYMPTFNTNKDSVAADLNGQYVDAVGGISDRGKEQYRDYKEWKENDTKTAYEIWDNDGNLLDELEDLSWDELNKAIQDGSTNIKDALAAGSIKVKQVEHTAKQVGDTKGVISMADWMSKRDAMSEEDKEDAAKVEEKLGKYWVYDTDGWVYWSSPIASGETTGLLLDGMTLNEVMDDTWYYNVKVTAQFVTADDVGKYNSTGFFSDGETPTASAQAMLAQIGVNMDHVVFVSALSDLQNAIATAEDGGIVNVDKDITITSAESLNFTGDKDKEVTLDLNSHTIKRQSGGLSGSSNVFLVNVSGMTLNIENATGAGGIRCDTTNLRGICAKDGGTINVNGGGDYMGSVIAAYAYDNSTINIHAGTWRMRGNDSKFAGKFLKTSGSGQINIDSAKGDTTLIYTNCLNSKIKIADGYELSGSAPWVKVVAKSAAD